MTSITNLHRHANMQADRGNTGLSRDKDQVDATQARGRGKWPKHDLVASPTIYISVHYTSSQVHISV